MGIFRSVLCHLVMIVSTASNCHFLFAFFPGTIFGGNLKLQPRQFGSMPELPFKVVHKRDVRP